MITGKISLIKNKENEIAFPVTSANAIYMPDGKTTVNEQLDNNVRELDTKKANRKEVDSKIWTMANMGQDVKEAMTGGSVAVVGKNSVLTENIVDGQVTRRKTNFYELDWDGNLVADCNIYYYGYLYNGPDGNKIFGDFPTLKLNKSDVDFSTTSIKFNMTSHITFWTENDEFISGYIQGSLDNEINAELLRNVPENASYVLFGFYKSRLNNSVLAKAKYYSQDLKVHYYDNSLLVPKENIIGADSYSVNDMEEFTLYPFGNLIDKRKLIMDKYYNTNGGLVTNTTCCFTEIEIDPSSSYKFNFESHITFWTENDEFISGYIQGSISPAMPQLLRNIPQNAKKVRMLIFKSELEKAVFALTSCFTNELKTSFYIPNLIVESENINNTQNKNPLYGKSFVFFGDSWCAGNTSRPGGWCNWIQEQNPSITVKNCGRHGADWFQCYDYWFRNETNYNSLSDDYDYIIIEAYTNGLYSDTSSLSKQLGSIDEFTYYTSDSEIANALGNTFAKDLELCLFNITKRWQGKKIGLMFPYKSVDMLRENNAFRVFREQVFKCCRKYNIPVFDNFDGCNIQSYRQEFVNKYFFNQDGVHLNNLGYEIITPAIENWMKTL